MLIYVHAKNWNTKEVHTDDISSIINLIQSLSVLQRKFIINRQFHQISVIMYQ